MKYLMQTNDIVSPVFFVVSARSNILLIVQYSGEWDNSGVFFLLYKDFYHYLFINLFIY